MSTAVAAQQWTSTAGPIQTKRVDKAIKALQWKGRSKTEITDHGEFTSTEIFGFVNDDAIEAGRKIGERFDYTITRENCKAVKAAFENATKALVIPVIDKRTTPEERAEREAFSARLAAENAAKQKAADESQAIILAKKPAWADALIVAEYNENDSDIMSDYHNHTTSRRVAIGWRRGKREDFHQLRAAAGRFEPTAHLETADAKVEHRENYSMGAGNYLKDGSRDSTGWCVKSTSIGGWGWYIFEDALPEVGESAAVNVESTAGHIEKHFHTKHGWDFYLVVLDGRVEEDRFKSLRSKCNGTGGWYSRKWGKCPGGFGFREQADAEKFLASV